MNLVPAIRCENSNVILEPRPNYKLSMTVEILFKSCSLFRLILVDNSESLRSHLLVNGKGQLILRYTYIYTVSMEKYP